VKTGGIINAQLCRILAELRHTDLIVVADSGLPVPRGACEIVDLALTYGVPSFETVLRAVLDEIVVEHAAAAAEIEAANPNCLDVVRTLLSCEIEFVPHETLKASVSRTVAVVRTGEATPFANVILRGGVPFG
jgi:D-ribose pyranase